MRWTIRPCGHPSKRSCQTWRQRAGRSPPASDNVLNRHRSDRKGPSRPTPRSVPMMMRSTSAERDSIAYSALQGFGERLTALPTAASIRVPVAPPTAVPAPATMPTPAAMPAPSTAAPPNLLDLSSVSAVSEDSGRRLLCGDAWQRFGKCHRGGGYGRPTKEQSTPRKAQSIDTKCTFQHL
jgi:hypothetical protein